MIRIATIGTSMITDNLVEVLNASDAATFVGALSRDHARADEFTHTRGGERGFATLEELCAADDVDAVYLGSPNALHHDQALACIAAGKHVLCEKPLCANEREALEVFQAADEAGVVVLEAMRPLHDPAFHSAARELGRIGAIRRATLRFGKYSSRYDDLLAGERTNIFDCEMASGALMDIGVYCVEPLVALFGEPDSVLCAPVLLDESTRELTHGAIDGAGVISCVYPDRVATLHYSKITADLAENQVEGELGTWTLDAISTPGRATIDMRGTAVRGAAKQMGYSSTATTTTEIELPPCANSMCYELADFIQAVKAVRDGADPRKAPCGPYGDVGSFRETTLASLRIMDEARRQAGVVFPADHPRG